MHNNWNNRFQIIQEPGLGYMNHRMQHHYPERFVPNFRRTPFELMNTNSLFYEGSRTVGSQAGALNIQQRMLHDKMYFMAYPQNGNFSHAQVPMNMYFPQNVQYDNYNHLVGTSVNTRYAYERSNEQTKLSMQTSMDYGYSSYSSEETQYGMCDYTESMNAASCIDDEVFHLEMSDEKTKARRMMESECDHEVPRTPKQCPSPELNENSFQHDFMVRERTEVQKSNQLIRQNSLSYSGLDNAGCDVSHCLSSRESELDCKLKQEKCLESNDKPMLLRKELKGIETSDEINFAVVPSTPNSPAQDENLAMYSDCEPDTCDEELREYNAGIKKRGLEIYNGENDSVSSKTKHPYKPENSSEYAIDVYLWKCSIEERFQAKDIFKFQHDVTPEMRHVLLNWLVSVYRQFQFALETWCLMVNIFDRFLSIRPLNKDCLQLVGLTAFFIAAKQEEVEPPEISELVSLCAKSYEARQFLLMEVIILTHLNFQLMAPTLNFFVFHLVELETEHKSESEHQMQDSDCSIEKEKEWPMELTRKLIERTLCEERLARIPYSLLAHALFDFLVKHFNMNCYDELDACANDEIFVDSYFKMLYVDILDEYEDDDL